MSNPVVPGRDSSKRYELSRRAFLVSLVSVLSAACNAATGDPDSAVDAIADPSPSPAPLPSSSSSITESSTLDTQGPTPIAPTAAPPTPAPTIEATPLPVGPYPFTLGVASGDPDDRSVVLWTRLAPDPLNGGGLGAEPVPVFWEAALDAEFLNVIASGFDDALPEFGHSLHIAAPLPADTWVHYRFVANGHVSPVGRTRSFPAAGDPASAGVTPPTAPPMRVAVSSCQNFEQGHYGAHRHLAAAGDDIDAFIFLGDYIYEYGPTSNPFDPERVHASAEATDLEGYRNRYAQYRSDPNLQAHHAARPWIVTWDDHEVDNDYASDVSQDDDDQDGADDDRDAFRARRAMAYQAWYEHMPVRLDPPTGPDYTIYREVVWGDLARFFVLDGRQYRDDQPTDGEFRPVPIIAETESNLVRALGPTALDPDHSFLGPTQERWLVEQAGASQQPWNVLAQQVMMHGLSILPGEPVPVAPTDTWDGYAGNRERLLTELSQTLETNEAAKNLVVLTGDFHMGTVGDLRADPFDPTTPVLGTELMAPAISSRFIDPPQLLVNILLGLNPQIKHFNGDNGYAVCEITHDQLTARYFTLVDSQDANTDVMESGTFVVTAGNPAASVIS